MAKTKKIKAPEVKELTLQEKEVISLNNLMASSVEKAFNMAVDNGAAVANPNSTATKIANVDSLPVIQFWGPHKGETLKIESYEVYKPKQVYVQARRITTEEQIDTPFGTLKGKIGDFRVIKQGHKHEFMSALEFRKAYDKVV